jgi:hypothetical protein
VSNTPPQLRPVPPEPLQGPIEEGVRRKLAWLLRQAEAGRVHAMALVYIRTDEEGEDASGDMFGHDSIQQQERLIGLLEIAKGRLAANRLSIPGAAPVNDPSGAA